MYNNRQRALMKALVECKNGKDIFNKIESDMVDIVSDLCYNICKGNIKLSNKKLNHLKPYKQIMHKLADRDYSKRTKRRIIQQRGGAILPILIPLLAAAIGGLVGR